MFRSCYAPGDFKKYFSENMDALGAPVPSSLFDTYQSAVANAALMAGALAKQGPGATVAELVGATVELEKLLIAGAFGAAAYTGLVIGSVAVATGRSFSCGSSIADFFVFLESNRLDFPGWQIFYASYPGIMDSDRPVRSGVGMLAKSSPHRFEFTA